MVGSEPDSAPQSLQEFAKQHEDVWRAIAEKHGLNKDLVSQQGWAQTQYMIVDFDFDRTMLLSKARSVGFTEEMDTALGYFTAWDRMRRAKILPPRESLGTLQSRM